MALGFGFNKTKVLAAAEKYVQQGKLQNAINEYQKVIKEDPKDLTVINTVGDLYARIGQNEQAAICFKKVGDSYANDGFVVKAIAMYKKLTKLAAGNADAILRLADLYTQQGLYNDARQQYVLVADQHMKSGNHESAAGVFKKILELDPENANAQAKLADLYIRLGKKEEARTIFLNAAQTLYVKGAIEAASEAIGKVLKLAPDSVDALLVAGQIAADRGDSASAVSYLERVADVDSRPEALHILLRAHLAAGAYEQAEPIASKLLNVHNDIGGTTAFAESLLNAGQLERALRIYHQNADKLLSSNPALVLEKLRGSIGRIKDNAEALEMLYTVYSKAHDKTHIGEVMELLAHASVQAGNLTRARDLYKELADLEPENELHLQNYKQILARLGEGGIPEFTAEQGAQALMVEEIEQTAAEVTQEYPEELAAEIKAAITDSDLFVSYNIPAKAIAPLEAVLPKAPNDITVNQRLAALYARSGRMNEAAKCCDTLHSLFAVAGHEDEAQQYADTAARYRREAGTATTDEAVAGFTMDVPAAIDEAPATSEQNPSSFSMEVEPAAAAETAESAHEIDLSGEWEQMAAADASAAPAGGGASQFFGQEATQAAAATPIADILEEARFYLSQAMLGEARAAIAKAAALDPSHPEIAGLRTQLEAAKPTVAEAETAGQARVAEFVFDAAAVGQADTAPVAESPAAEEAVYAAPVEITEPPVQPHTPAVEPEPAAATAAASSDVLGDFVLDLEESLGDDFSVGGKPAAPPPPPPLPPVAVPTVLGPAIPPMMPAAATSSPTPVMAAPAMSAAAPAPALEPAAAAPSGDTSSVLSDIFDEFKDEVEQAAGEAEDPDTHYNLGVAFKEMGLLDEAIGELQKVCQAIDRGHKFGQVIQAYTWLAHCFVEKGVPQAGVKWYERALKTQGLDEDSRLAIYYELAAAYEAAGNRQAALQNFMEVYGSNIDYRDVAERIKALKS